MKVTFQPDGAVVEVEEGTTILEAAQRAGVQIESVCGGRGTCAKCKVIPLGKLSPLTALEKQGLSTTEIKAGYRLACQASILSDVRITIPQEARISDVTILSEGIERSIELAPWVSRIQLQVPPASLADQKPDLDNIVSSWQQISTAPFNPTLRALCQLPRAFREQEGLVTVTRSDDRTIQISPGHQASRLLGIAFDIGTTTVVGYLMDLESGKQLAVGSEMNPQTRYGDDVVSRIEFASRDPNGLLILQTTIRDALNRIIHHTTHQVGADAQHIRAMTVVGNTTMHHLFLGISPTALAQSPYVPAVTSAVAVDAGQIGIDIYPDATVWVLPNIAGWVGADTVGVILSTGIHQQDELALAIDIGTNGEMALGSRNRLLACSTAAGPAFEGAHLSCGMRAADGAVDRVSIDSDVFWHTIADGVPRGICGSGLVDAAAEMLRAGILDSTGRMQQSEDLRRKGLAKLADRIVERDNQRNFELVRAGESNAQRPIRLTQRDIRELQLAKGAIRAGIEILLKELGIHAKDIRRVYIAGAFGNYIRPQSALRIGLMPRFPNAEIISVGNAAGSGAKLALLSRAARTEAQRIPEQVHYLELSLRPDFQEEFAEAMLFKE